MNTSELLIAWGCPSEYTDVTGKPPHPGFQLQEERDVASAANWYPELTEALNDIVRMGDIEALEDWRDSASWDDEGKAFASNVRAAFDYLIDAVKAKIEEEGEEE